MGTSRAGMRTPALVLAGLVGAAGASWGQDFARHTADPSRTLRGDLLFKVPDRGPDPPYAGLVVELEGAIGALYLRRQDGTLWRVEPGRFRSRRRRQRFAVSIEPGSYHWVGFAYWRRRFDRRFDLYEVLDAGAVPLEVRPGVVTYGGRVRATVTPRRRVHRARRQHGNVEVHPGDFDWTFTVEDDGTEALERMQQGFAWVRRLGWPVEVGLRGPGAAAEDPTPDPGGAWGRR